MTDIRKMTAEQLLARAEQTVMKCEWCESIVGEEHEDICLADGPVTSDQTKPVSALRMGLAGGDDRGENRAITDLEALLRRASVLAADDNPALSLLFSVLSAEPPEVAAGWAPALDELEGELHPLGYGPTLARAASKALAQWSED